MSGRGAAAPVQTESPLDYDAALERVMGLTDFERSAHSPKHASFHLQRMALLMDRLGRPHIGIPTVHIAGTDGKGSTAAMVASMLASEGYRVGLYSSPHLHSAVERIRVGLKPVERNEFAALVNYAWPAVEWVSQQGEYGDVTFFEILTAMAFLHFSQVGAHVQVIEVGLGGRLDATNVVSPAVCVITNISLDHISTLGDTLPLIAAEKAGIIKRGVPVVIAPQPDKALGVFLEVSKQKGAPVVQVDREMSWRKDRAGLDGQSFDVSGLRSDYSVRIPLLGDHQIENASTAIATAETLTDRGLPLSTAAIVDGLRQVRWPGRLQVLSGAGPQVVVDGAHNPASAKRLVSSVRELFKCGRVILIFGALGGHSARGMLAELAGLSPHVIAVRSRHPRSALSEVIGRTAGEQGLPVLFQSEDIGLATSRALEMAEPTDLVLATGSLSVVAEVIEGVDGIEPELYPYLTDPTSLPTLL